MDVGDSLILNMPSMYWEASTESRNFLVLSWSMLMICMVWIFNDGFVVEREIPGFADHLRVKVGM